MQKAMNITLSVDKRIADAARKAAGAMGKSLDQAVHDYLEQLAGAHQVDNEIAAFEQSARGDSRQVGGLAVRS